MANGLQQLDVVAVRRGWLRAAAIGLLASVASFFALLALWQPGVGRSLVQAALQYEPGAPATPLDLDAVRAQLASPVALQEALRSSGQSGDSANVAAWQSQLSVHRAFNGAPSSADRIVIELPTQEEAVAIAVVQALSQRFLSATHASGWASRDVRELQEARTVVTEALVKEDAARRAVDAALKQQFEHLHHAAQAPTAPLAPMPTTENPQWIEQQQKMAALVKKRDDLLLNLTAAHPKVQDVDSELEELQSRQSSLPRYLDGPAVEPPAPELSHAADPLAAENQQRVTAAQDAYATARAARLEAQAAVEVLERSTAEAPTKQPRFLLAQSAQAVQRDAAVSPVLRCLVVLLTSLLVMLSVMYLLRPRVTPQLLRTVAEINERLRLPVIARLKLKSSDAM